MNKTADRTVALDKGCVDVYTKNGVTLYAYQTRDLIDNEVFVLAKKGRGVVIELPCFFDNIRELTDFLKSKGCHGRGEVRCLSRGGRVLPAGGPRLRHRILRRL